MIQLRQFVLKCSLKRNCEKKTNNNTELSAHVFFFMYNYELRIQEHCISTIHE